MQTIETVIAMRAAAAEWRAGGRRVALVPTLGALHAGHASLIRLARGVAEVVVVSAFVNPLQFGPSEDFARYPRTPGADAALAEREGAAALFTPTAEDMFPRGFSTQVTEDHLSLALCGPSRPALFRGVLTCWLKLCHLVQPAVLVLGEKDAQQVAVVRKAAADLALPVEVMMGPTVRDEDDLALSARHAFLTPTQREAARAVPQALRRAHEMVRSGVRSADRIVAEVTHLLAEKRRLRVIYIAVVQAETMEPLREVAPGQGRLMIAYWVDEVRLTDNLAL